VKDDHGAGPVEWADRALTSHEPASSASALERAVFENLLCLVGFDDGANRLRARYFRVKHADADGRLGPAAEDCGLIPGKGGRAPR
jgi:hypothetical protein